MGIPVQGGDLLVAPNGETLKLPKLGQLVLVNYPSRGWLCPGWVVKTFNPNKDTEGRIGVVVFNINALLLVQKHMNLKHRDWLKGDEPFWFHPVH